MMRQDHRRRRQPSASASIAVPGLPTLASLYATLREAAALARNRRARRKEAR